MTKGEKAAGMSAADVVKEITRKDTVTLSSGREVAVRVCKIKDIPAFMSLLSGFYAEFGLSGDGNVDPSKFAVTLAQKLGDGPALLKLISNHWTPFVHLAASLTDMKAEEMDDLDPDDGMVVFKKLVEINYRFFTERILPLMPAALVSAVEGSPEK